MINRWQGNSGRVQRLPERGDTPRHSATMPKPVPPIEHRRTTPVPAPNKKGGGILSGLDSLKKLIPGKTEDLETEDIILLLILYLMYRESGDSELLMIMGAMFLL